MKRKNQTRPAGPTADGTDKEDTDCEDQKLDPELKLLNSNSQSVFGLSRHTHFKTRHMVDLNHISRLIHASIIDL